MVCQADQIKDCLPQILLGPFLNTLTHIVASSCFYTGFYIKMQHWVEMG